MISNMVLNMSFAKDSLDRAAQSDFEDLLERALKEDMSEMGDVTSQAIFKDQTAKAVIVCKQEVCLAGLGYAQAVFKRVDATLDIQRAAEDGQILARGSQVLKISGAVKSMLAAERIALNFLGYLSGIASRTRQMVEIASLHGTSVILDTRKTLPAYRHLAKQAVAVGGAKNHRIGLYDMVMIKNNHIDAAGSIQKAVDAVRSTWRDRFIIELECRNIEEVRQGFEAGVGIIMLDNMDLLACKAALQERSKLGLEKKVLFEASGDMEEERIGEYSALGLDFISVGALTHSVKNANFSLRIDQ